VTCGDKTLISRRAAPVTWAIHLCGGRSRCSRCELRVANVQMQMPDAEFPRCCLGNQKSGAADSNRNVLDASHELFRLSGNSEASGQPSRKKTNESGAAKERRRRRQRRRSPVAEAAAAAAEIVPVAKVGACNKGEWTRTTWACSHEHPLGIGIGLGIRVSE